MLDGLEITVVSSIAALLTKPESLNLPAVVVTGSASVYLLGEVAGALFFGHLSDRLGRRNLFILTLAIYLIGSGLTALTLSNGPVSIGWLFLTRFIAGMGIGGEYAAINSAIDELIPAQYRGRIDLLVNGTYWLGALFGTLGSFILLNELEPNLAWRLAFLLGPVLGLIIIIVRRNLPESPRWQIMNGRAEEAEASISQIEREVERTGRALPPVDESKVLELRPAEKIGYVQLTKVLFKEYPTRAVLGASLMITQSFLYNSIFFTYTIVLAKFYGVPAESAPVYLIAFCIGNFLGPLLLGRFFDTVGRKVMISGTYILSGILLAISAVLFNQGMLTAMTQTLAWCLIFFFASAGASAGYLTVSELFPLEVRAKAIAVFFCIAQAFGALGPVIYGKLIGEGPDPDVGNMFIGFMMAAVIMIIGGLVAVVFGVNAEGKSLEDLAPPLGSLDRPGSARAEGAAPPSPA
ncbi:MFS transporter [Pseudonocardia eucalypti]|uniref:MFS transporter n=1 Tax=Pseudonocardia eucalypti TaxID=648755 RepID=A0ABP9RDT0_9PSEU